MLSVVSHYIVKCERAQIKFDAALSAFPLSSPNSCLKSGTLFFIDPCEGPLKYRPLAARMKCMVRMVRTPNYAHAGMDQCCAQSTQLACFWSCVFFVVVVANDVTQRAAVGWWRTSNPLAQ